MVRISAFLLFVVGGSAQLIPLGGGPRLEFNAVVEPPLTNTEELKLGWGEFRERVAGHDVWHRFVYDTAHQQYFGYDLLVDLPKVNLLTNQPRIPDEYRLTFASLTIGPDLDQLKGLSPVELPKYPEPQTLMAGDVMAVDLLMSPDRKRKVVDYIRIDKLSGAPAVAPFSRRVNFRSDGQTPREIYERFGRLAGLSVSFEPANFERLDDKSGNYRLELANVQGADEALNDIAVATHTFWKAGAGNSILVMQNPPRPASSGGPKDYTVDDGPLKFDFIGDVSINGKHFAGEMWPLMIRREGASAWFAFPDKGRFLLSLVPHQGFVKAGVIRDNGISFRFEGQAYEIRMNSPIVGSGGVWNLWVMRDASYRLEESVADLPSGLRGKQAVVGGVDRLEKLLAKP